MGSEEGSVPADATGFQEGFTDVKKMGVEEGGVPSDPLEASLQDLTLGSEEGSVPGTNVEYEQGMLEEISREKVEEGQDTGIYESEEQTHTPHSKEIEEVQSVGTSATCSAGSTESPILKPEPEIGVDSSTDSPVTASDIENKALELEAASPISNNSETNRVFRDDQTSGLKKSGPKDNSKSEYLEDVKCDDTFEETPISSPCKLGSMMVSSNIACVHDVQSSTHQPECEGRTSNLVDLNEGSKTEASVTVKSISRRGAVLDDQLASSIIAGVSEDESTYGGTTKEVVSADNEPFEELNTARTLRPVVEEVIEGISNLDKSVSPELQNTDGQVAEDKFLNESFGNANKESEENSDAFDIVQMLQPAVEVEKGSNLDDSVLPDVPNTDGQVAEDKFSNEIFVNAPEEIEIEPKSSNSDRSPITVVKRIMDELERGTVPVVLKSNGDAHHSSSSGVSYSNDEYDQGDLNCSEGDKNNLKEKEIVAEDLGMLESDSNRPSMLKPEVGADCPTDSSLTASNHGKWSLHEENEALELEAPSPIPISFGMKGPLRDGQTSGLKKSVSSGYARPWTQPEITRRTRMINNQGETPIIEREAPNNEGEEKEFVIKTYSALAKLYEAEITEKERVIDSLQEGEGKLWWILFFLKFGFEIFLAVMEFEHNKTKLKVAIAIAYMVLLLDFIEVVCLIRCRPVGKGSLQFALACLGVAMLEIWYFHVKLYKDDPVHIMVLPCMYNICVIVTAFYSYGKRKGWWSNMRAKVKKLNCICKGVVQNVGFCQEASGPSSSGMGGRESH